MCWACADLAISKMNPIWAGIRTPGVEKKNVLSIRTFHHAHRSSVFLAWWKTMKGIRAFCCFLKYLIGYCAFHTSPTDLLLMLITSWEYTADESIWSRESPIRSLYFEPKTDV